MYLIKVKHTENYEENIIHPNFNFFIITKLTKSRTNSNKNWFYNCIRWSNN